MTMRAILFALVAGSALSTAAFAAAGTASHGEGHPNSRDEIADRCSILESQYSAAVGDHQSAPNLVRANGLYSMGTSNCQANEAALGVHRIEQALRDIGVRPAA